MAHQNIQIVKIAFKSGRAITTAVHGITAIQKQDSTGYTSIMWRDVTPEQYTTLKSFHPDLEKLSSINVGQVEAVSIIDNI